MTRRRRPSSTNRSKSRSTWASIRATLEVGGLEQTVTVEASAAMVQTTSSSVASTIDLKQISNLPLATRNALDFLDARNTLTRFIDHPLFKMLMLPTRRGLKVLNLAAQPVLKTMELGPRDRLSQAFWHEQKKGNTVSTQWGDCVLLDMRHLGAEIIAAVPFPYPVAPIILSHHERWDGKGYPEGLKGEEIPLLGRVLGVADFLDALTSDRSYRKGLPLEEALQMVKDLEGQAFDPVVVKAAVDLHERGDLALPTAPNPEVSAASQAQASGGQ